MNRSKFKSQLVDVIAYDSSGEPVLVAEVKGAAVQDGLALARYIVGRSGNAPYVLVVDPVELRLYRRASGDQMDLAAVLKAPSVFEVYDREYGKQRIFEPYLTSLTEAWLNDLANHWKESSPPGSDELRETGLLDSLAGGTTETEVALGGNTLR